MPLYDFRCDACGETFEERTAPGEAADCPACGAPGARRLFTPIPPPPKLGLRGAAARQSDSLRKDREAVKKEAFRAARRKRRDGG
jgi:putative FmdB family regulatory protein